MATKKKAVSKQLKKVTRKVSVPAGKKTSVKTSSGWKIAQAISLQDPDIWSTKSPGVTVSHFIDYKTASKRVKRMNDRKTAVPKASFMQPEHIDKKIILDLLKRKEVVGLRLYFGLNEHDKVRMILVGYNKDHKDVLAKNPSSGKKSLLSQAADPVGDDEGAIDMAQGCPSYGSDPVMLPGD